MSGAICALGILLVIGTPGAMDDGSIPFLQGVIQMITGLVVFFIAGVKGGFFNESCGNRSRK